MHEESAFNVNGEENMTVVNIEEMWREPAILQR